MRRRRLADVRVALEQIREHYDFEQHGVELLELAGGYQILTRPVHAAAIERAQFSVRAPKLTAAALETLAVIAYRQPVGRAEIEEIRGVSAGGVLRSLQERGLIEVVGRSEALGRPLLYGTAPMFLELLGLRDLADLPRAEELTIALQPHRRASTRARTTRRPTSRPNRERDAAPAGAGPRRSRLAPGRRAADRGRARCGWTARWPRWA